MSNRLPQTIWLFFGILFAFSFLAVSVNRSSASPAGLPTRPTDIPTAVNTPTSIPATVTPVPIVTPKAYGAYIQLQVSGVDDTVQLWTVVQWQDTNGGWHPVNGWQGTLDNTISKTWWVAPEDFNTGPFRWRIYAQEGGNLLATSDSFHLPAQNQQISYISVTLPLDE